jgi:hypothetical protein
LPSAGGSYQGFLDNCHRLTTKTESNKDVDVFLKKFKKKTKRKAERAEAARRKADQLTGSVKK